MDFFRHAGVAAVLIALSLSLQCGGLAALINWGITRFVRDTRRLGLWRSAALIVRLTGVVIVLHLAQIALWAGFYRWTCFPTWEAAVYFSTTSYSTAGYGDLVLPKLWRHLGPLEAMTGVLMCGLSVSFLFAVVTRLVGREVLFLTDLRPVATPKQPAAPFKPETFTLFQPRGGRRSGAGD
ncbi:MAG: two pore domain potassium channel family protein [Acidobacteriia bacterium]|nr:two pore domain potassium channel family protein [Terriglobia bacterium]